MPTVHLIIKGRVQGVFYRASAKQIAKEIGATGWVKNTDEGDVEIVAVGTEEQLRKFIDWCKVGPTHATVTEVVIDHIEGESFKNFEIRK
jgi:acylphosphatase